MITEPILICESGDVSIYDTVAQGQNALEVIDVENGEYVIFDSAGMVLQPRVKSGGMKVEIRESATRSCDRSRLVETLRNFLSQLDEELLGRRRDEVWRLELDELLALMAKVSQPKGKKPRWKFW